MDSDQFFEEYDDELGSEIDPPEFTGFEPSEDEVTVFLPGEPVPHAVAIGEELVGFFHEEHGIELNTSILEDTNGNHHLSVSFLRNGNVPAEEEKEFVIYLGRVALQIHEAKLDFDDGEM